MGARVGRLLGIFTLRDTVVFGGLLFITPTLICAVSLWKALCGVVFCLNIYTNCLIYCSFSAPMVANGDAGVGLGIDSIISMAALVSDSWLDSTGILLCSGKKSTVSTVCSDRVLVV